jgi:hypothetical protein
MLSDWKGCEVLELNVQADHIHLVVSIPPKLAISELMAVRRCGTLKGKLAIKLFKSYPQLKKKRSAEATVLGQSLLGTRLFCQYGWHQRTGPPERIRFAGTSSTRKGRIAKRRIRVRILIYSVHRSEFLAGYARIFNKPTYFAGGCLVHSRFVLCPAGKPERAEVQDGCKGYVFINQRLINIHLKYF